MKEKNTQFPAEEVTLPSKGLLYPKDSPLSKGVIEMKYMTAKEEDILTNTNLLKTGRAIDVLYKSLLVGNGKGQVVQLDDMIVGDKSALMLATRILGYGPEYGITLTDDNRCHYMMHPDGIIWESMNALATAFRQKQTEHIHFIQYDDIVSDPEKVMQGIHWFLKLKPYKYDFNNIVAKDREKDSEVYGLPTMHEVRKEVKKISKPYSEVLSTGVINKYITYDFWNQQ